jgi:hypothetical protein
MPSKEIPEAEWPLSPVGVGQAQQLAHALKPWKIDAIFVQSLCAGPGHR